MEEWQTAGKVNYLPKSRTISTRRIEMTYFNCYSAKLAGFLRKKGFKIVGTKVNLKKPQYDIFLFEETEELKKAVDEYCRSL